jgi:polyisoprenoid-binding protein YceI
VDMQKKSSVAPASAIPDGDYVVDVTRSELRFRAKAFGLVWFRGRMPAVEGTVHVREGVFSGDGAVAADRISTGLAARDWHLRSSHYLHAARHSRVAIVVDDADPATGQADATLTVRGVTAPLSLRLTDLAWHEGTLRLELAGELDRTPLPMLPPLAGVSRIVHCQLVVEARPARSGPA